MGHKDVYMVEIIQKIARREGLAFTLKSHRHLILGAMLELSKHSMTNTF